MAAPFHDLVAWLLTPDCDTPLQAEFVHSFPYFTSEGDLARKLADGYSKALDLSPLLAEQYRDNKSPLEPKIQIRIR